MNNKDVLNEFTMIEQKSLVDKAEEQLINILVNKGLKVGDKIPKEIELCEALGVSRTVIRECLGRLKTMGLLKSIKHKGTVITSPNIMQIAKKSMIPKVLDNKTLRDMFELRMVIEVGMADLLFKNKTIKDVKDLRKIIDTEPEKSSNMLFDIEHEIAFHGKLYEISNNQTLKDFQNILLPIFNYVYDSGIINKPIDEKKFVSHKKLVDIIETGNAEQFRSAMRLHLYNHFKRLGYND